MAVPSMLTVPIDTTLTVLAVALAATLTVLTVADVATWTVFLVMFIDALRLLVPRLLSPLPHLLTSVRLSAMCSIFSIPLSVQWSSLTAPGASAAPSAAPCPCSSLSAPVKSAVILVKSFFVKSRSLTTPPPMTVIIPAYDPVFSARLRTSAARASCSTCPAPSMQCMYSEHTSPSTLRNLRRTDELYPILRAANVSTLWWADANTSMTECEWYESSPQGAHSSLAVAVCIHLKMVRCMFSIHALSTGPVAVARPMMSMLSSIVWRSMISRLMR
mmetsp:Transcript_7469/g.18109  ORF Transcript_7469/g.18109 Transcript_7469/m.18109 type:complete len:274 (-) Transcript_7469:277-1098(-)